MEQRKRQNEQYFAKVEKRLRILIQQQFPDDKLGVRIIVNLGEYQFWNWRGVKELKKTKKPDVDALAKRDVGTGNARDACDFLQGVRELECRNKCGTMLVLNPSAPDRPSLTCGPCKRKDEAARRDASAPPPAPPPALPPGKRPRLC